MINSLTSVTTIETVLMKLTLKQKLFIYQIARLEYRIYKSLFKLNEVNLLIAEEEQNLISINAAIKAAGTGKIADKLIVWKTKTEYKLFKLNLRKNKIDVVKLVINQSKLEQAKQALATLEKDLTEIEKQKNNFLPVLVEPNLGVDHEGSLFPLWQKYKQSEEESSINQSIRMFLKENLKLAS